MKPLLALLLLTTAASAETLPGFDHLTVDAPHRPRPLEASVWYPSATETYTVPLGANPAFTGTMVQVGTAIAEGRHPLVIVSHGSGGNIDNLGWLAEGLVARGAIVAGVNHPGATSGDSSPRQLPMTIDRTRDLQALLATLTADPAFGPRIDSGNVTALGFSLGGATVLAAGGAMFDAAAYAAYCDRFGEDAPDCLFMAKGGVDPHALPPEWQADMRIDGLSRIVAVDPAYTWAVTDDSIARLPPVHFVTLGGPDHVWTAVDIGADGSGFVGRVPGASRTVIDPAWHFSFLGLCTPQGPALLAEEGEDPVCDDPEGADRAAIHAQVIDDIATALGL
jgi:predicted dienelactone hydrolase